MLEYTLTVKVPVVTISKLQLSNECYLQCIIIIIITIIIIIIIFIVVFIFQVWGLRGILYDEPPWVCCFDGDRGQSVIVPALYGTKRRVV